MSVSLSKSRRFCSVSLLVLVTALLFSLAACDSGGPDPEPGDVAGTYDFTELRFDPSANIIPDVNVLDTLTTASLALSSTGRFVLEYQFRGARSKEVALGTFTVNEDRVRLNVGEGDASVFDMILLPAEVALRRESEGVLVQQIGPRQFNVSLYLEGANDLGGTLHIRLED